MNREYFWKIVSLIELVIVAMVILFDLFIPTLIILGIIIVSLIIRRESISILGFKKSKNMLKETITVFILVIVWTIMHLGLFISFYFPLGYNFPEKV
jgi:cytochrome c oxidase assembly factor CtaG